MRLSIKASKAVKTLHLPRQLPKLLTSFAIIFLILCGYASADDIPPEHEKFFENKVRPLLVEQCIKCHGPDKQKADLRLDSLGAILVGGESGPALVPGDPDASLLIEAIRYESFEMPPSKQLDESQIAILTKWVKLGAPWPGSDPSSAKPRTGDRFTEEDRQWWALQPVTRPDVPASSDPTWTRNDIDQFVLKQLSSASLTPAPPADRLALVRRLYFDVTGLPPTPEQVDAFVRDESPDAYERLVDRLLDSRAYGEHVARAWLDLVRYADSDGYRADGFRDHAWQYRDYVIDAFNEDKPYDRFVQEQLAADEMFPDDPRAQAALGYLRHWVYEWNSRDAPGQWTMILEDLTDNTADVFMGLGLQCAKCHNHKFDPLLQKDYFRLRAYFAPIMPVDVTLAGKTEIELYEAAEKKWDETTREIDSEIAQIESSYRQDLRDTAINRFPDDIQAMARKPKEIQTPYERQMTYLVMKQVEAEYDTLEDKLKPDEKDRVLELKRELESLADQRPKPLAVAMGVRDVGREAPPTVLPKRKNELVLPGIPSIIDDAPAAIEPIDATTESTGRRSALAKWLTDPANPLSTRVIVNRIWQSHFGRGLAFNTSDFGRLGEPPTHPELLDYLTTRFIEEGWSIKSLRRLILNSATYRQSTQHPEFARYQTTDPTNRFYWRSETKRLQADQIRDALLAVSGQLKSKNGGPSNLADAPNRTIYTRMMRNSPDELLNSFDLPLFFSSTASRNTTTTPVQSLLLINSDLMLGHSRKLASNIVGQSGEVETQVALAWRQVFGRRATEQEVRQSVAFIDDQTRRLKKLQSEFEIESVIQRAKIPYRDGLALRFDANDPQLKLTVADSDAFDTADFTIEAFFQLNSVDKGAAVRTIAGKWDGKHKNPGWGFGVSGKGSRRKPQTLVLQIVGENSNGEVVEKAVFSDQRVKLKTPYYAAAAVRLADDTQAGSVTFHLKDLSNDDEALLTKEFELDIVGGFENALPLSMGSLSRERSGMFDGLIDDVRLVGKSLAVSELLYTTEQPIDETIGFWRFETDPGILGNDTAPSEDPQHLEIHAEGKAVIRLDPTEAALVDFCHALLNSNEFLYVQ